MKQYLYSADILIPKSNLEKWAVIACDQYTSDKKYWKSVEEKVADAPSALRIILPEIFLSETEQRVKEINLKMKEYLNSDVFDVLESGMVYVEREITGGAIRKGVLGAIDLEDYEYVSGSKSLTRATEQTVADRLPPRIKIRRGAPAEFPHILIFIDDPTDSVMNAAGRNKDVSNKLYDFDLMQKGGHIEGYSLGADSQNEVNIALNKLVKDGFLFAVGDGNHSLATAKECYKLNPNELNRYALVEIVNIHNSAIEFEPIYRVLFGINKKQIIDYLMEKNTSESGEKAHQFTVIDSLGDDIISLTPTSKLPVGTLQGYLDDFLEENPDVQIDYIHGINATRELCKSNNTVGFIFEGMKKNELFDAVDADGSLPRKTFSMGHADDKRFYIEGRRIR